MEETDVEYIIAEDISSEEVFDSLNAMIYIYKIAAAQSLWRNP